MRLAFLDIPDDRVDLIPAARHDPDIEVTLVVHPDPDSLSLKIAEVLQIPRSTEPLDLLSLKPDRVVLPFFDSPSAAVLHRAGISERIFITLDEVARTLRARSGIAGKEGAEAARPAWAEDAREGSRLDRIREALALTEDRQRLFREVLALAVEQTGAESGSIMVLDEAEQELRIAFADGLSADVVRTTRQRVGEGIAGEVIRAGVGRVINERIPDPRFPDGRERTRIAAAMCEPLRLDGRVFGVINVSSDRPGARFEESDLARLRKVAEDISAVLERVLRASLRDLDAAEFRALRELDALFDQEEMPLGERLRASGRAIGTRLDAECVQIHLADARRDRFRSFRSSEDSGTDGETTSASGMLKRAHERGESFFLTTRLARPAEALRGEPLPNLMVLPLQGARPLGVLVLESVRRLPVDLEEFTRRAARIAGHLARLLERQRAGRDVSRQSQILTELSDAAARLMMARDPETLALEAAAALQSIFPGGLVSVRLPGSGGELLTRQVHGEADGDRERFTDLEARLARATIQSGLEEVSAGSTAAGTAAGEGPVDYLAVPVRYGDDPVGCLVTAAAGGSGETARHAATELDLQGVRRLALYVSLAGEQLRGQGRRIERTLRDPETGLLTGAGLESRLDDEVKRSDRYREPFLLTLCALPEFDRVRRKQGEKWSQDFLRELARELRRNVREVDAVAWMGGGQFAVLSPATQKDHGVLLDRILDLLPRLDSVRGLGRGEELRLVGRQVSYPEEVGSPGELLALIRGA
jgi:GGDEF domain-containing protein/GAF domain-containing protein